MLHEENKPVEFYIGLFEGKTLNVNWLYLLNRMLCCYSYYTILKPLQYDLVQHKIQRLITFL
jgi:hypothetical protein